jgi:apolipoprotein N-acyltransferase
LFDQAGFTRAALAIFQPMTMEAARHGARLIAWPECGLSLDPMKTPWLKQRISAIARAANAYLVVPFYAALPGHEKEKSPVSVNAEYVIAPDGTYIGRYAKQHRIRSLDMELGPRGYTTKPLPTRIGRMGLMICYDSDFTDIAAKYAKLGAEYFVIPSHDLAAFVTRHHPGLQMFRAVEQRRAIVKADIVNGAMIVDPKGRFLSKPPDGLGTAEAEIPLVSVVTPFSRVAPVFGIVGIVALFAFLVLAKIQKEKAG